MSQKKTSQKEDESEEDGSEDKADDARKFKDGDSANTHWREARQKSVDLIRMRSSMEFQYHTPMIGI